MIGESVRLVGEHYTGVGMRVFAQLDELFIADRLQTHAFFRCGVDPNRYFRSGQLLVVSNKQQQHTRIRYGRRRKSERHSRCFRSDLIETGRQRQCDDAVHHYGAAARNCMSTCGDSIKQHGHHKPGQSQ